MLSLIDNKYINMLNKRPSVSMNRDIQLIDIFHLL